MYAIYGNMDPINIPPMLAYIPYIDPMGIYIYTHTPFSLSYIIYWRIWRIPLATSTAMFESPQIGLERGRRHLGGGDGGGAEENHARDVAEYCLGTRLMPIVFQSFTHFFWENWIFFLLSKGNWDVNRNYPRSSTWLENHPLSLMISMITDGYVSWWIDRQPWIRGHVFFFR